MNLCCFWAELAHTAPQTGVLLNEVSAFTFQVFNFSIFPILTVCILTLGKILFFLKLSNCASLLSRRQAAC